MKLSTTLSALFLIAAAAALPVEHVRRQCQVSEDGTQQCATPDQAQCHTDENGNYTCVLKKREAEPKPIEKREAEPEPEAEAKALDKRQCYVEWDRRQRKYVQHCNNTPRCQYDKYGRVVSCVA